MSSPDPYTTLMGDIIHLPKRPDTEQDRPGFTPEDDPAAGSPSDGGKGGPPSGNAPTGFADGPQDDDADRPDKNNTDWSIVIDDEADEDFAPVPVDPTTSAPVLSGVVLGREIGKTQRRPLVPAWARSRTEFELTAKWAAGHVAHTTAYHLIRIPKYGMVLVLRSPRGTWRVLAKVTRWTLDAEATDLRLSAVRSADAQTYIKLRKMRDDRVRLRAGVLLVGLIGLAIVGGMVSQAGPLTQDAVIAALVLALGWVGMPADRALLDVATVVPRARKLSADVVLRAIVATGLAKDAEDMAFPQPITRDGPGWRAVIDLPYGVTAGAVVDRRDRLASGLDLAIGQVWPEGVPGGSLRRLVLWVGDEDLSQSKPVPWPLIKAGTVDLFKPFPFGLDPRGNVVPQCLMFTNKVIGSVPRMGKTFSARLDALAATLDASAELHIYDLKGGQDWMPFEHVAHRFAVGDEPDAIDYALTDLRELQTEMQRRYKTLRGLPADVCPESKVTRELADKRKLGLFPILLSADECQVWFMHKAHGEEFEELCTDLVKRGPAVGIILLLATQKPDKDSLPSGIRDNVGTRFGMRVMTWQVSDMVLGSGMAKAGYNAASLTRADRGIGYLVGASDDVEAQLCRSYLCDSNGTVAVIARARALREAAGTITGYAAGETPDVTTSKVSILADVAAVLPADETKVWSETIVTRLAELRPALYGGWTPAQLSDALKPYGVATGQVWGQDETGKGANRRGILADDVRDALAKQTKTAG